MKEIAKENEAVKLDDIALDYVPRIEFVILGFKPFKKGIWGLDSFKD